MQKLHTYRKPSSWSPGKSFLIYTLWFTLGSPLLSCRFLPGSYWRILLLKIFGSRISWTSYVKPGLRVKFPWRLIVGSYCWLGEDVWIDNLSIVTLRDNVCISQGAYLCTGNHNFKSSSFDLKVEPIFIDSESWIAARSVLAPGTSIGFASVVSLGSVVSGSVPPYSIVRGNPALIIKDRRE